MSDVRIESERRTGCWVAKTTWCSANHVPDALAGRRSPLTAPSRFKFTATRISTVYYSKRCESQPPPLMRSVIVILSSFIFRRLRNLINIYAFSCYFAGTSYEDNLCLTWQCNRFCLGFSNTWNSFVAFLCIMQKWLVAMTSTSAQW